MKTSASLILISLNYQSSLTSSQILYSVLGTYTCLIDEVHTWHINYNGKPTQRPAEAAPGLIVDFWNIDIQLEHDIMHWTAKHL